MPLLKCAPEVPGNPVVPEIQPAVETHASMEWAGVPIDVYRHFGVEIGKVDERDVGKLKDIYEWSKRGSVNLGEALLKVRALENQLGTCDIGQHRYDKMWNWVRLSRNIDDLNNRREALKR